MNLDDVERLIASCPDPRTLFGGDIDGTLRRLRLACHPDRHLSEVTRATALFARLGRLAEAARNPEVVRSPKREYALAEMLGVGDVSDVHRATSDGKSYVLKVSRIPEGAAVLERDKEAVATVLRAAGDEGYRKYYPTLSESFPVADRFPKRVNVYVHEPGGFTLEQVRARYPSGVDGHHLGWVFKRLLTATGFAHRAGVVHGAITPGHVLIRPADHGLQLIGWGHSVDPGVIIRSAPAKYLSWYPPEVKARRGATPAADIFLAASCLVYAAGGDPVARTIPESVPLEMRMFFRSCLLDEPSQRPDDAWALYDEFDELLRALYGPPKFHMLDMG